MNEQGDKNILVYADWISDAEPQLIGILSSSLLRGKEIFSFEYDSHLKLLRDGEIKHQNLV